LTSRKLRSIRPLFAGIRIAVEDFFCAKTRTATNCGLGGRAMSSAQAQVEQLLEEHVRSRTSRPTSTVVAISAPTSATHSGFTLGPRPRRRRGALQCRSWHPSVCNGCVTPRSGHSFGRLIWSAAAAYSPSAVVPRRRAFQPQPSVRHHSRGCVYDERELARGQLLGG
jgi:hypothetical protein